MEGTELIRLTQLPVIEEHLRGLKEQIKSRTEEAVALVCTEDTLADVKAVRADLRKIYDEMESQRKAVKKSLMEPYEEFEAVYKGCVSDAFRDADNKLKDKIAAVENDIKGRAEQAVKDYFQELCQAERVEWLTWGQAGITVSLTDAKQKTLSTLRGKVADFVVKVAQAVNAISEMDNAEEIMAEYRQSLNLPQAIAAVSDRHRRIEAEKEAAERRKAQREAEAAAVQRVEAVAPPTIDLPVQRIEKPAEKVCKCHFTAYGTKEQLTKLKAFMIQEGIRYE
ncbi:MAG TPA: DUF1351 domain-containing protein [Candidatus Flavonifractor merdipullorum]|uniref:DUF1351 domain-containing protein n=1 Tax=Candidatus Flavonifractor merdipullorum TaxID=2838590 RepID=A0A9D1RUY1_9FIRM|nr:DUF1351 domain-containing protein [Candidatus Flavonifractor merdipullorum]